VADGSTLEALFRKLGSLVERPTGQLAGKMCVVIDLVRQLLLEVRFREEARVFGTNFIPELLALAGKKSLRIPNRGFYDFQFFVDLMGQGAHFIIRLERNAKIEAAECFSDTDKV